MITIPNRTDMDDESLALRIIDEKLRQLAEDVQRETFEKNSTINQIKKMPGEPGKDGVSPDVTVEKKPGSTVITITDKEGTKTVEVENGKPGVSVKSVVRFYWLAVEAPGKPVVVPPGELWTQIEPTYEEGSTANLYYVDQVIFSDDSFTYTDVQLSSAYAAARAAYNKAVHDREHVLGLLDDLTQQTVKKILETAEGIVHSVESKYYSSKDMDDIVAQLQTQINQNSTSIEFKFLESLKNITDLSEETYKQFNTISKYIRFESGNIILGEEGNAIILRQSNDRISFIQNGKEVSYWSNNKFYVTDAEILGSLRLGDFAFIPKPSGNLSFKKVT